MPYFSIIVPIYNVERYLKECIDSILKQSYKDYEVILVNDGSTDNCKMICEEYAKKNERIKVVNKKNGGLSSARNTGIMKATGEWLVFVDSDDYIEDIDFLNNLNESIQDADVIIYSCKKKIEENNNIVKKNQDNMKNINNFETLNEKLAYLNNTSNLTASAWTHACRTEYIKKNNIYFLEEQKVGEDIEWLFRLILHKPKILALKENLYPYIYRMRKGSLSGNRAQGFWKHRYNAINKILYNIENATIDISIKKELYNYLTYQYFLLLADIAMENNKEERKNAWKSIKKFDFLIHYGKGHKVLLCKVVCFIFGKKLGAQILKTYEKNRNKKLKLRQN